MSEEVLRLSHDIKSASHPGQKETIHAYVIRFFGTECERILSCVSVHVQHAIRTPRVKPKAAMQIYYVGIPMERVHLDMHAWLFSLK